MRTLGVVVAVVAGLCGPAAASPEAEQAPGALVVVVDRTMAADKLEAVNQALIDGVTGLAPRDQLAVVELGETAKVRVKLQKVKTGKAIATKLTGFKTVDRANLAAGLRAAAGLLETSKLASRRVLMITDDECVLGVKSAVSKLQRSGITVSAVGYQSQHPTTIELFASAGGGEPYMIEDAAELAPILAAESGRGASLAITPPVAIVFVVDKSASSDGVLDLEKLLVQFAIDSLADTDLVGVVGFDTEATVYVPLQRAANRLRISAGLAKIKAGGGTNIYPGLKEAFALLKRQAAEAKYVYLLSDGESDGDLPDGLVDLAIEMKLSSIVVSAIGMPGAEHDQLRELTRAGNGRFLTRDKTELTRAIAASLDRAPP